MGDNQEDSRLEMSQQNKQIIQQVFELELDGHKDARELYKEEIAGFLIKTDDGYLFLEKVASMEPYIVSKYSNIDEFKAYLTALYGNHVFDGGSKPIFMQNDKWLNAE